MGTRWYTVHYLNGKISYSQALKIGIVISICTGVTYAIYNLISITWFYPNFLDQLVRARLDSATPSPENSVSINDMRGDVSVAGIALSNLIRLSILGTLMSLFTSFVLARQSKARQ
jgi:hypothetical protein